MIQIFSSFEPEIENVWGSTSTKITVSKNTSETRYDNRRKQWVSDFKGKKKLVQTLKHYGWWIVHNFIAHPLLAFLYKLEISVKIHDWTSQKLNKINGTMHTSIQSTFLHNCPLPNPQNIWWWIIHNLIIHPLIGIIPCKITFNLHDLSAKNMKTPGWV